MRQFGLEDLARCRDRIDELDEQIVELLNRRTSIVEEIGRIKQHLTLNIYEPKREEQVFANITRHNQGPLPDDAIRRIFERIIDEMRTVQKIKMLERTVKAES
ncbi:MAG: chorismate mutase [Acidobacteriaceae bacterium]|nr:chorismate mutase [Acidobacteriaceae bacterium]